MAQLTESTFTTRSGSAIRLLEGGTGAHALFAIGGISVRAFAESPIRLVLEDAADHGARFVLMDIAGSGASRASGALTMQGWLDDLEEIYQARVAQPATWTGASIGAWLMLLAHRRHPHWARAMCALAPAFDWDRQYVGPALGDATLRASMAAHHVLGEPFTLAAPLHVIAGARDELAPVDGTRRFIENARGAPCTGEILPDADHGVAKLDPPLAMLRYQRWLRAQLGAPL